MTLCKKINNNKKVLVLFDVLFNAAVYASKANINTISQFILYLSIYFMLIIFRGSLSWNFYVVVHYLKTSSKDHHQACSLSLFVKTGSYQYLILKGSRSSYNILKIINPYLTFTLSHNELHKTCSFKKTGIENCPQYNHRPYPAWAMGSC